MTLPDIIKNKIVQQHPSGKIQLAVASDLTNDLKYGEEWLVALDNNLHVVHADNGDATFISSYSLEEIKKIEAVNLIGGGVIEIEVNGSSRRLINFTNAKISEFAQAVEEIKSIIKGSTTEPHKIDVGRKICDICHFPIPDEYIKCPRCTEKGKTFRRILIFVKPHAKLLFLIFLTMVAGTGFGLITPYMSKLFIDFILKPDPISGIFQHGQWLPLAVLALLISYIMQHFFSGLYFRLSGVLGHKAVYEVRGVVFDKLEDLSMSYFDKHQVGSIMARVNQDTRELKHFLVDFIPITLESFLTLVGVGVFLFILSWQLTLFVLIPIIGAILFVKRVFSKIRIYFRRYFHRRSMMSAFVNDSLSGMRVVKAFGQEDEEIKKFDKKSSLFRDAGIELERRWSIYHPILNFFIMFGSVLVWFIGGYLIIGGKMSLGSIVAYLGYLAMFYRPVFTLTRMVEHITSSLSAAERIFDVIDTEPDIKDADNAISLPTTAGAIEFRNVTFGYDKYNPVIKDFSVNIASNEIIGLVGKSGAGKSTIINLIFRLYDADKGRILLDGIDLKQIKYEDLRKHVGVVLQETFLFNGSIYENIAYARPDATRKEIIDSAIAAHAHEFILEKPEGYDTEVGERGNRLSGGEKQRIAIARAILKNPRILILDEATSSLDTETESKIQQALKNLTKGRTTIAIAHRLSTLRNCDRLLVIDDGHLKEIGTHAELMKQKGVFYNLVHVQKELSKIIAVDG